ncbi:hypothetical protein C900_02961 [Fulvivirga imtechensis AK7]|uniref:DUF4440 domain-containing protein n=2 Tax=Fulvivirga TaxID=396811 RepID=L8JV76_9BACT|nr:hypothetical protein C900_02961 [Fulvivirga imtechensis AK7]
MGACGERERTGNIKQTFRSTVDIHLDAITTRNLTKLEPTVAEQVTMIGPDGTKLDTKGVFMDFHKKWFAQKNWEWKGKILITENSDSLGYALVQYQFTQKDTTGNITFQDNEYLILIFKNFPEGWQLMHDQNTQIQELNN